MNPELSTNPRDVARRRQRAVRRRYRDEMAVLAEEIGPGEGEPIDRAEGLMYALPFSQIPEPSDAIAVLQYLRSIGWGPGHA